MTFKASRHSYKSENLKTLISDFKGDEIRIRGRTVVHTPLLGHYKRQNAIETHYIGEVIRQIIMKYFTDARTLSRHDNR